jgi:hypothetical protein
LVEMKQKTGYIWNRAVPVNSGQDWRKGIILFYQGFPHLFFFHKGRDFVEVYS